VEALVGRASISAVALGDHHTLFLDDEGSVWACGENKEVGRVLVYYWGGWGEEHPTTMRDHGNTTTVPGQVQGGQDGGLTIGQQHGAVASNL
jgi:alpha-tubulin suppressor-like RCC1 family protein